MLYVKFRSLQLPLLNSEEVSIIIMLNHICTEWYYLVLHVWFYNNYFSFLSFYFLLEILVYKEVILHAQLFV